MGSASGAPPSPPVSDDPGPLRCALAYGVPLFLLLAILIAPMVSGTRTLYLRDVVYTHLEMKWSQSLAMRSGTFPILDPYRGGGQPLAGNPNAVPFYPTNVLFLVAPVFWALNAHFWIHLLLAPLACFWMARRWGLTRQGAWAAAACYTVGGFFISHLSLLNLIAGATLAPALVAGFLAVAAGHRRGVMVPVVALIWALLLVSGDPLSAGLALALAATAVAVAGAQSRLRVARSDVGWLVVALGWGTIIALPQVAEFLRLVPLTFRGQQGYLAASRTIASFDPRQAAEWILPLLFGRPDTLGPGRFWGDGFYLGSAPYFLSLYPGLLTFGLVAASLSVRRGPAVWAWGAVIAGVGLALGRFNPLARALFESPLFAAVRFPVKFWLPAAIGGALLCGIGLDALLSGPRGAARRNFVAVLGTLAAVLALLSAALGFLPAPVDAGLRLLIPTTFDAAFVDHERGRWLGLALYSLALLGFYLLVAHLLFRRSPARWAASAALVAAHVATQLAFLRPLYPMDAPAAYLQPPAALAYVPDSARVVNPDHRALFGPTRQREGPFPSSDRYWQWRRAFAELYPMTGPIWARRFDLDSSPEGLSSVHTVSAQRAIWASNDTTRVRLLAAWGISRLVLDRPLAPGTAARLLARAPGLGHPVHVYEIPDAVPEASLARDVYPVSNDAMAAALLSLPAFDPRRDVALLMAGQPRTLGGGTARVVRSAPEALEVETFADSGGAVLVVQRTDLLYTAEVDGQAAPIRTANVHRIGVEVPAGRHSVRLAVDRRVLERSAVVALLALLLLPALGWIARERSADTRSRLASETPDRRIPP
jgi:hypothetical protein